MKHRDIPQLIESARIPGTRLPRPTIDVVFKRLMQNNLPALKSLLTAVLSPQSPIESITLLPTELQGPHMTSKASRLDLLVKLHDGTLIDIEVQSSREAHFVKRSLYYTFQMIGGTLGQGDSYENLPSLAGIYIFDDVAFPSLKEIHSSFQLLRAIPSDGVPLQPNILRLDFIELPKISNLKPEQNPLFSAWVQFLSAKSVEDLEDAAHCVPEIKQLVGELRKMSAEKKFINLLNKNEVDRVIAQRAQAEALRDAKAEGKAEGEEQGRRQAMLNSIHVILSKKMSITRDELLSRIGHRSIAELEALLPAALDFTSPADLEAWKKEHLPLRT
jgi:predicted transposase/invertase (TIGR01784 family)